MGIGLSMRRRAWLLLLVVLGLAAIVALLWAPFGWHTTGLSEEWSIVAQADDGEQVFFLHEGSISSHHRLRPFVFASWGLGYLLSPDSFLGSNVLLAAILLGKALGLYALVRWAFPELPEVAWMAAALSLVFPADEGLMTLRSLSIHLNTTLFVLAVWLLTRYWDTGRWWVLIVMWAALTVALGIYEIIYPLVAVAPALILWRERRITRRFLLVTLAWYLPPLVMGLRLVREVWFTESYTYQSSFVSREMTYDIASLADGVVDLYGRHLLRGWWDALNTPDALSYLGWIVLVALVVGGVGGAIVYWTRASSRAEWRRVGIGLAAGLLILLLGYVLYLPTFYRFENWRVYILSSVGASVAMAFAGYALTFWLPRGRWLYVVGMMVGMSVATADTLAQHDRYADYSYTQQAILGEIATQAPEVADQTCLVLVDAWGITASTWLFEAGLDFDDALRYLYDDADLRGGICYPNATGSGVPHCTFDSELVTVSLRENPLMKCRYENVVAFTLEGTRDDVTVRPLYWLDGLATSSEAKGAYKPLALIDADAEPPARVQTLLDQWWTQEGAALDDMPVESADAWLLAFDGELPAGVAMTGWDPPETAANGATYQWMTRSTAMLELPAASGRAYTLRFRIVGAVDENILDTLQVMANGEPVALERDGVAKNAVLTGTIPAAAIPADGGLALAFRVDPAYQEAGASTPQRTVMLAFDWLEAAVIE